MDILVTGAGGFIGQALASALLSDPAVSKLTLTDITAPPTPSRSLPGKLDLRCVAADLSSLETCKTLFAPSLTVDDCTAFLIAYLRLRYRWSIFYMAS